MRPKSVALKSKTEFLCTSCTKGSTWVALDSCITITEYYPGRLNTAPPCRVTRVVCTFFHVAPRRKPFCLTVNEEGGLLDNTEQ
eukprot:1503151-Rhodomonas_salina.4